MGLLADDTNTDKKYNVEKEASTYNKDNAKEWIKSTLTKRKKDVKDVNFDKMLRLQTAYPME
jgi:hypothetical protein